jgi:hypothetical protein
MSTETEASALNELRDLTLDVLLDLDRQMLVGDPEGGHWVRFAVTRVCPEKPHELDYSLTLHGPDGERLVGFDSAQPVANQKRGEPQDHPRAPSHRRSPPAAAAAQPTDTTQSHLDRLPTPEQIAAEVRRRPIGTVIADICRDLGIMPSHQLWRELQLVIIRHGGSLARLVNDILHRAFPFPASARPAAALQSPAASGAGPP